MPDFITQEFKDELLARLDRLIADVPAVVPSDPDHPRGCPRAAWLMKAAYWKGEVEGLVPGFERTPRDGALLACVRLFLHDFERRPRLSPEEEP